MVRLQVIITERRLYASTYWKSSVLLDPIDHSGREGKEKRYLVPGLWVTSINLSVGHLIRLLVHPSRAAENVLLQVRNGVQNDTRLRGLPAIQVIDDCSET